MQKILVQKNELGVTKPYNHFFLKIKESLTLKEIIDIAELPENYIQNFTKEESKKRFFDLKSLKEAKDDEISFFINTKYRDDLVNTKAGVCIIKEEYKHLLPKTTLAIVVKNPHYIYTKVLNVLFKVPQFVVNPNISKKANISKDAVIGENVEIQDGVYIGSNVKIGDGCKICANAVLNNCIIDKNTFIGSNACVSYAEIGQDCVIQNNSSIGQCGFGFSYNDGFNYKIPQLGIVKIGNYVEIGASSCIDRGAITDTVVGDCTKIDNLVHIAHGVKIGRCCFFAGGTVVAGSVEFGNFVQVGGHSAINGHIKIGDGVTIAGHSGVAKSVAPMEKIGGYPAMKLMDWERMMLRLSKLMKKE